MTLLVATWCAFGVLVAVVWWACHKAERRYTGPCRCPDRKCEVCNAWERGR